MVLGRLCTLVLVAIVPWAMPTAGVAAAASDLSGVWELNRELSTGAPGDLAKGGGDGMRGRPPGGPGGGTGGPGGMGPGGGGPGSGRDGKRPSDDELKRMRDLMREVLEAPARLIITDEKTSVTFTETDGRVLKYATSGKAEKHQLTNGTVETRARWQASTLSIETKLTDEMKVTRAFKLDPETGSLIVTTTIDSSRGPRDMPPLRAVYDRAGDDPR